MALWENHILQLNYKSLLTFKLNFTLFVDLNPLSVLTCPKSQLSHFLKRLSTRCFWWQKFVKGKGIYDERKKPFNLKLTEQGWCKWWWSLLSKVRKVFPKNDHVKTKMQEKRSSFNKFIRENKAENEPNLRCKEWGHHHQSPWKCQALWQTTERTWQSCSSLAWTWALMQSADLY